MAELPAYYPTKHLLAGTPDRNTRFIHRAADGETVASFPADKSGWSERNKQELTACLGALNALAAATAKTETKG